MYRNEKTFMLISNVFIQQYFGVVRLAVWTRLWPAQFLLLVSNNDKSDQINPLEVVNRETQIWLAKFNNFAFKGWLGIIYFKLRHFLVFSCFLPIIVGRIMAQIRQKRDRLDKSMKLGTVTLLTLLNNFRRVAQKSWLIILVKNMFYVTMATLKT